MKFNGFTDEDFDVFKIDGLDARMESLKNTIRPKLEILGGHFAPTLSTYTGDEMFYHVAKHARRKVNPPEDTWVAIANSKRGYKMLPHFQIGLFETHLFIWFAIIYEAPIKAKFADQFLKQLDEIKPSIPDNFVWSADHTKPDAVSHRLLKEEGLEKMIERLGTVKKSELLCGVHFDRHDPIVSDGQLLLNTTSDIFKTLIPLYRIAQSI